MPEKKSYQKYTPEFKIMVIETMHKEGLSHREAAQRFKISNYSLLVKWERIYLEEGKEALYVERRGGHPAQLQKGDGDKKQLIEDVDLKEFECFCCQEGTVKEKARAIWELRHDHKIGMLIDIAGIPRSTYYYYSKQFENPKPDKYAEIKLLIRKIYADSKGRYGYRRITKELRKTHKINHKTVYRLMCEMKQTLSC